MQLHAPSGAIITQRACDSSRMEALSLAACACVIVAQRCDAVTTRGNPSCQGSEVAAHLVLANARMRTRNQARAGVQGRGLG